MSERSYKRPPNTQGAGISNRSAIARVESGRYPKTPPFNPGERYPEYPSTDISGKNAVYDGVRQLLIDLKLDASHVQTERWNPLGEIIKPGNSVVIKPNFVSEPRSDDVAAESIVTHGSVIRPLIDYSLIALQGTGSLVVADAPQADSNFEAIKETTGIQEVIDFINVTSPIKVALVDLRTEYAQVERGLVIRRHTLPGDPKGYTIIDLAADSAFHDVGDLMHKTYGSDYDFEEVRAHHTGGRHQYCISNTILGADVVINVPKLKTHKKAGLTGCLKNMVGINGNKNYLPHYRFGAKNDGGDAYSTTESYRSVQSAFFQLMVKRLAKAGPRELKFMTALRGLYGLLQTRGIANYGSGDWHGNDTIWRTIVDLNRIVLHADKSGQLHTEPQRRYFAVVDGVIGGEGNGPFGVSARSCEVLVGGFNPVMVDVMLAKIMGFDWKAIPQIIGTKEALFPAVDPDKQIVPLCLDFQQPDGWDVLKV